MTLPENYTATPGIAKTRRYEAIGNSWTVDVVAHIFKGLKVKQSDKTVVSWV